MDEFNREDFEKLAAVKDDFCVSVFIPTHMAGWEVNEGIDRIAFKNHIQKIQKDLLEKGDKNTSDFLKPAFSLIDDTSFWKELSSGLVVFMNRNFFKAYKVPVKFEEFSTLGSEFELTPMLPLLMEEDTFYTLSISHNRIRLFKNNSFTFQELNVSDFVPDGFEDIITQYNFNESYKSKNINFNGLMGSSHFKANQASHGYNPKDNEYLYLREFINVIDKGIIKAIKNQNSPLVLAAVEQIYGVYKDVNTYKNLVNEFISGNPDQWTERDLHQKAFTIVRDKINKPRKKDIEKYPVWAGTGKTSYELDVIVAAAFDGRIESVFITTGKHLWGRYDQDSRALEIHSEKQSEDVCIYNLIASKTIENSGKAYLVSPEEMPEKGITTEVAATFRY